MTNEEFFKMISTETREKYYEIEVDVDCIKFNCISGCGGNYMPEIFENYICVPTEQCPVCNSGGKKIVKRKYTVPMIDKEIHEMIFEEDNITPENALPVIKHF